MNDYVGQAGLLHLKGEGSMLLASHRVRPKRVNNQTNHVHYCFLLPLRKQSTKNRALSARATSSCPPLNPSPPFLHSFNSLRSLLTPLFLLAQRSSSGSQAVVGSCRKKHLHPCFFLLSPPNQSMGCHSRPCTAEVVLCFWA